MLSFRPLSSVTRIEYLEPRPALELALSVVSRRRVDVALARLAQEARLDGQVALGRELLASLLDENPADRRFTGRRRQVRAGPPVGLVAVEDRKLQQMRHAPLVRWRARIGDQAKRAQDAVAVEQRRQDHRMSGQPRAALAARIERIVDRLADIFVLVVEPGVDFVQAALFGLAFSKIRPVVDPLPRRSAVAAAGELAEAAKTHRLCVEPELQAADLAAIDACLRVRRCTGERSRKRRPGAEKDRRAPNPSPRRHFFIGSHWRVSLPQKSTQSS